MPGEFTAGAIINATCKLSDRVGPPGWPDLRKPDFGSRHHYIAAFLSLTDWRERAAGATSEGAGALSSVRLLAPVPRPSKVVCIGLNFSDHAAESGLGFAPMGPALVTTDEIPDPQCLRLTMHVNDRKIQDGNTDKMIFSVAYIISFLSRLMTLEPGDVISTGLRSPTSA